MSAKLQSLVSFARKPSVDVELRDRHKVEKSGEPEEGVVVERGKVAADESALAYLD